MISSRFNREMKLLESGGKSFDCRSHLPAKRGRKLGMTLARTLQDDQSNLPLKEESQLQRYLIRKQTRQR